MNEVKIVVTGQYRPGNTVAELKKDLADITKYARELEKAGSKSTTDLDKGLKKAGNSADMAKEAIKKLGDATDKAFDGLKDKVDKAFKAAEEERIVKVKAEFDKNRMKNSLDGLGGFDIDITSGIGPKIANAFGKVFDTVGKGLDLGQAGAKGAASFVGGLGDGLKAQHPAVQAAVYGTLATAVGAAAPLVGGALAGGIVAGFGAGIGGLAIVAAAQNGKVRQTFSDLWSGIVNEVQSRTSVIEGVLIRTAGRAQTVWNETGHKLTDSFAKVAPGLEVLFDGLLQSFQRFAPALDPLASAASKVFADLGDRLPGIVGEIADAFTDLSASVEKNPQALGDFIASLGEIIEFGADVLGVLNDIHEGNKMVIDQLAQGLEFVGLKEAEKDVGNFNNSLKAMTQTPPGPMKALQEAIAGVGAAGDDAAKKVDAVRQALDLLNGLTPDYTEALASAAEAVGAMDGAFKQADDRAKGYAKTLLDSTGAFDVTNENGRKLYAQVNDVRDSFDGMAAALASGQISREQFIADTGRMRDKLNETWSQAGLTKDQIAHLNSVYSLTPDQIATMVRLLGAADAEAQMNQLARARTAMIYITQQISTIGGYVGSVNGQATYHDRPSAHGGPVARFASGGIPGGRTNAVVNDWGSQSHGEAIRLPQGSTVIPASMTRSMESRWGTDRGAGGSGTLTLRSLGNMSPLERMFFEWFQAAIRGGKVDLSGAMS
ncbi:hypothetical protein [Lentzea cavernae]|uniref:Uncharacterized protein n=1 Tax=Lentzea cavernae TaxID=2020703 RepID=A0ABQ3MT75_9PSEU|nr:hypothetical protein [Lentzea cavernae]GHH57709.1 hypothetical protein GCM10017774_77730 [Lentzea cavernae]